MTAPRGPDDWAEAETEPFENADDGGKIYEGFIIDRGKDGVEARDASGGLLGLFPNTWAAWGVIPNSRRTNGQAPDAFPSDQGNGGDPPTRVIEEPGLQPRGGSKAFPPTYRCRARARPCVPAPQ